MNLIVYDDSNGVEETYELASFGARLGARLIDVLIIIIPNSIIPIVPAWLYWSLMQSGKSQATVGQNALGIKVIGTRGQKVTFGMATGRFFGNFLNILTFFIGFLMFFMNNKRQCLHDMISGCIVVKQIPIATNEITEHLIGYDE